MRLFLFAPGTEGLYAQTGAFAALDSILVRLKVTEVHATSHGALVGLALALRISALSFLRKMLARRVVLEPVGNIKMANEVALCPLGLRKFIQSLIEETFPEYVDVTLGELAKATGVSLALWRYDAINNAIVRTSEDVPVLDAVLQCMARPGLVLPIVDGMMDATLAPTAMLRGFYQSADGAVLAAYFGISPEKRAELTNSAMGLLYLCLEATKAEIPQSDKIINLTETDCERENLIWSGFNKGLSAWLPLASSIP